MEPKIFMAAGQYVQGVGAFDLIGEKAAALGHRAVVICDQDIIPLFGERIDRSMSRAGIVAQTYPFTGENTLSAIEQLTTRAREHRPDVAVGVGGGRALDAAKGAAKRLRLPFVSVPTIASTDAPAARGIGVYDEKHRPVVVEQLEHNPAYVLVDTEIIAKAPPRFLRAGMGDAVAKKFEVEGSWRGGALTKHGTRPLRSAVLIANDCYEMLRNHGPAAMRAAELGRVTNDLEYAVEAALLLSCLAFENGGLWIAHSVVRGLASARGVKDALHGEQVAYGTLVQVTLEQRPEPEVAELRTFLREVGLPLRLIDLGLSDPTDDEIEAIVHATVTSPYIAVQAKEINPDRVRAAIRTVEARSASELCTQASIDKAEAS
jgi:glycerol dehydrogenase